MWARLLDGEGEGEGGVGGDQTTGCVVRGGGVRADDGDGVVGGSRATAAGSAVGDAGVAEGSTATAAGEAKPYAGEDDDSKESGQATAATVEEEQRDETETGEHRERGAAVRGRGWGMPDGVLRTPVSDQLGGAGGAVRCAAADRVAGG